MAIIINMGPNDVAPTFGGGKAQFHVTDKKGLLCLIKSVKRVEINGNKGGRLVYELEGEPGSVDAGVIVEHGFNLWHNDPDTKRKAAGWYMGFVVCAGQPAIGAAEELIGKFVRAVVVADPQPEFPNNTNIAGIRDKDGNIPGQAAPTGQATNAAAQQQAAPAASSWGAQGTQTPAADPAAAAGGWNSGQPSGGAAGSDAGAVPSWKA